MTTPLGRRGAQLVDRAFRDSDGRLAVAQAPNAAIVVWAVAAGIRLVTDLDPAADMLLRGVGSGALVVWAVDELVRGAAPFRRLLGAAVLAYQLTALVGALR